jgi:hypothetical protein
MDTARRLQTARQFIAATPVPAADRNGALGCASSGNAGGIIAGALAAAFASWFFAPTVLAQGASDSLGELLVGKAALGDWRTDAPLVRRKITELPPPYATRSASNFPRVIAKPASAAPKVPPGFQVELFAANLNDPRVVRVAPNGDIFIAESEPGRIRVLRAAAGAAEPAAMTCSPRASISRSGARPTSATISATISFPTSLRVCVTAL